MFGGDGLLGRRKFAFCDSHGFPVGPRQGIRIRGTDCLVPMIRSPQSVGANIHDERSVADALAGAYGVVNAVSLCVEHGQETFHSVHVEFAQRVAAQDLRAGVDRLIHISGIGAAIRPHNHGTSESAARPTGGPAPLESSFPPPGGQMFGPDGHAFSHRHPQAPSPASDLSGCSAA